MPHDPELVDETRSWLIKADEDLAVAEVALQSPRKLLGAATYHSPQAAEKKLKAYLVWHSRPFPRTHSLFELGEVCWTIDSSLRPTLQDALTLNDDAWKHRYPGEPLDPTRNEALAAVRRAQSVFSAILARSPEEVQPA